MYPPFAGRIRAQVCCQGPNTAGIAYLGDLWLERDRVVFAATARAGARFWGFVLACLIAAITVGVARFLSRRLWHYTPSFEKPGSSIIMGGEIASVTKLRTGWDIRLAPNPRNIERVLVRPYYEWPLEQLQSLVPPGHLPPLSAPRWPRPVPSAIEMIGAAFAVLAFTLSDGVRERLQASDDERTLVLTLGAIGVLAAAISLFDLRKTPRSLRVARWFIALALCAMAGTAVGRAIHAYVAPPPARADR